MRAEDSSMAAVCLDEQAIFEVARKIGSNEAREAYLQQVCGDDEAIGQRVRALLKAYEASASFLESPAAGLPSPLGGEGPGVSGATIDAPAPTERPGTVIGAYKLLQQIGEGGMGTVFMAEQTHPVQRKVALKVIKPGMDSRQIIARFEAERQALAMMDHVNIARVFDGGTTAPNPKSESRNPKQIQSTKSKDPNEPQQQVSNLGASDLGFVSDFDIRASDFPQGRPYFVMELVHGVPITKYCDDNHLTPRERLELFVPVCQAIQHAHQKGIIHRDIKPSNVMITLYDGKPVPKVIDFGVAKAIDQKLTDKTLFTQYGTMVGTTQYMSPEQAEMSALGVDTRSDIFSLGVLLYELLTGSTPLTHKRLKEAAYAEVLRMIKEEEPPKPSTRLSDSGEALASISAQRHMEPAKLTKLVRGELDWIVMKCLEKDRNRRYETASGFAADVQRYLNDEPVQACPPSAAYRLRKFTRRNRGPVAAGLALAALLVLGTVGTSIGLAWALRAEHTATAAAAAEAQQRQDAETQRDRTKTANQQLKENLKLAMQALDEVYFRLTEDRLAKDPKQQKEDDDLLKKTLAFYERFAAQNSDDPEVRYEMSRAFSRAGIIHTDLELHARAKQAHAQALALAEQLAADYPEDPKYRANVGYILHWLTAGLIRAGEQEEAKACVERALVLRKRLADEYPKIIAYRQDLANAHGLMAFTLHRRGEAAAAVPHYRQALDLHAGVIAEGLNSPIARYERARKHLNLGGALARLNDPESVEQYRKAIPIFKELDDEGEKYRNLPVGERVNPSKIRRDLTTAHLFLGHKLTALGDPAAENHLAKSVAIQAKLVADVPNVPSYRSNLAQSQLALGEVLLAGNRPAAAEEQYRQAMAHMTQLVADHPEVGEYLDGLALCHIFLGNLDSGAGNRKGAAEHYRQAFTYIEDLAAKSPKDPARLRCLAWNLATCLDEKFRDPNRAVRVANQLVKDITPRDGAAWKYLGIAHYRAGDWKAAVEALEQAMELKKGGDNTDWLFLAMAHWQLGHKEEARRYYDRAVERMPSQPSVQRFRAEAAVLLSIGGEQKASMTQQAPGKP
jgi:serine/threonine protein kinase/Tfp pilus assembly protein PilF